MRQQLLIIVFCLLSIHLAVCSAGIPDGYRDSNAKRLEDGTNVPEIKIPRHLSVNGKITCTAISLKDGYVGFSWTIENSKSNLILERSADGVVFSPVVEIKNFAKDSSYYCTDYFPLTGMTYYRLVAINEAGEIESEVIPVFIRNKKNFDFVSIKTYINETLQINFLTGSNEICTLMILEPGGMPVYYVDINAHTGFNSVKVYCPFLRKGNYTMTISSDEQFLSEKISLRN